MPERAVLACIAGPPGGWAIEDELAELEELARSAGAEPVAAVLQRHRHYEPATLFTRGKVEELAAAVRAEVADLVLVGCDLSPRQQLHLEEALGCRVIDRTRLILDIFACRAKSREGKLQVELAQLCYLLPRLVGLGRELSRTGGGIGTRGPGETKLETDRRKVRARIAALRRQLAEVAATRQVQRTGRRRVGLPLVALVGYTNAGKSTLHRALCGSDVLVADQMFATLDPTTRVLPLPANRRALLTDTVGFVHDLPSDLVAAFSATLEEVRSADLLLEVVDQSHPRQGEQRAAVEAQLRHLGAAGIPRILVWNKCDLPPAEDAGPVGAVRTDLAQVRISARTGQGLEELRALIAAHLPEDRVEVRALLPYGAESLVHAVRRNGHVEELTYHEAGIALVARCSPALAHRLRAASLAEAPAPRA
jgi:GTP-binding protein HflX